MLPPNMNKKAVSEGAKLFMFILFLLILFSVVLGISISGIIETGKSVAAATKDQDDRCLIQSALKVSKTDIDNDKRDDSCDACVCEKGCHNDDDDQDGDKLPDICDKNPKEYDENPVFNEINCPADKLKVIGSKEEGKETIKQCRPS